MSLFRFYTLRCTVMLALSLVYLGGAAHLMFQQHVRCVLHGEWIHLDHHSDDASDQLHRRVSHIDTDTDADAHIGLERESEASDHEHCSCLCEHRQDVVLSSRVADHIGVVDYVLASRFANTKGLYRSARYRYAPKQSPPASSDCS